MATIHMTVHLPDECIGEFVKHVRLYESPRSDKVHVDILAEAPAVTAEEMATMLREAGELTHTKIFTLDSA